MCDRRANPQALAQKTLELRLHGCRGCRVVGPFFVTTDITKSAEHDAAVAELLPVIVAPARVHRSRQGDLRRRRRGEHLQSHGAKAWSEPGQHVGESSDDAMRNEPVRRIAAGVSRAISSICSTVSSYNRRARARPNFLTAS